MTPKRIEILIALICIIGMILCNGCAMKGYSRLTVHPDGSYEEIKVWTCCILCDSSESDIHARIDGEVRQFDIGRMVYEVDDEALTALSEGFISRLINGFILEGI